MYLKVLIFFRTFLEKLLKIAYNYKNELRQVCCMIRGRSGWFEIVPSPGHRSFGLGFQGGGGQGFGRASLRGALRPGPARRDRQLAGLHTRDARDAGARGFRQVLPAPAAAWHDLLRRHVPADHRRRVHARLHDEFDHHVHFYHLHLEQGQTLTAATCGTSPQMLLI